MGSMTGYLLPVVTTWDEWRPIFTDAAMWRPVVERVWAAEPALRQQTGIVAPGRVVAGYPGTCAVFCVDERAVIKFFPPMVAGDAEREATVYRLLAGRAPGASLLAAGVFHDRVDWPYLVVSYVAGEAWREAWPGILQERQELILEHLGGVVRLVHETPLLAGKWPTPEAWRGLVSHSLLGKNAELRHKTVFTLPILDAMEALLQSTDWFAHQPRLLHGDLTADHLLVAERDGRWTMAGLIDWADALVGDPYYEWVVLWFDLCRRQGQLFQAFWRGYDPHGDQPAINSTRLLAFTMLHRFGASIIGEALPPEAQRQVKSLDDLALLLFEELPI
jgi:hygromycin-B 7''-O-kinase